VDWVKLDHPVNIGFWRSVGHSMNDFFYESFLDEMARPAARTRSSCAWPAARTMRACPRC
jgi:CO/xanthine dehydrogenase Mo-binding subunit